VANQSATFLDRNLPASLQLTDRPTLFVDDLVGHQHRAIAARARRGLGAATDFKSVVTVVTLHRSGCRTTRHKVSHRSAPCASGAAGKQSQARFQRSCQALLGEVSRRNHSEECFQEVFQKEDSERGPPSGRFPGGYSGGNANAAELGRARSERAKPIDAASRWTLGATASSAQRLRVAFGLLLGRLTALGLAALRLTTLGLATA